MVIDIFVGEKRTRILKRGRGKKKEGGKNSYVQRGGRKNPWELEGKKKIEHGLEGGKGEGLLDALR